MGTRGIVEFSTGGELPRSSSMMWKNVAITAATLERRGEVSHLGIDLRADWERIFARA